MESNKWLIGELIGKTIIVRTREGVGTLDASLKAGEYKGILLDFDGNFMKLEYEIRKFASGTSTVTKQVILINAAYTITIDEYSAREG